QPDSLQHGGRVAVVAAIAKPAGNFPVDSPTSGRGRYVAAGKSPRYRSRLRSTTSAERAGKRTGWLTRPVVVSLCETRSNARSRQRSVAQRTTSTGCAIEPKRLPYILFARVQ